ncbi:MAG TPA: GNAT family N-acetyltransferase [Anaerolineae bacterium]|jgi:ribosomal protein S18 acetylase RimI-like enzyme|nr:GNAT family N-acetyltransferase [Anaerolineae bacterium]
MTIIIRQLPASAIDRIAEIDRSEHVTVLYHTREGELVAEEVDMAVPAWHAEGDEFSVEAKVRQWRPILDEGGVLLGALDGERLAGFAMLRYRLDEGTAQLAVLHVSRPYRRKGIASQLTKEVCRLARADGARSLYVSATPSNSAVGLYTSLGFTLVDQPHPELFALEPEDIHMVKAL